MSSSYVFKHASLAAVAALLATTAVQAHDHPHRYESTLLAKAQPDECYGGIGASYEPYSNGCSPGRLAKVNQAYIWGLAQTPRDLWLGTVANVNCLVEGGYLGMTGPHENGSYVCEFGSSSFRNTYAPSVPASIGDWRPSQILRKPLKGGALVDAGQTMDAAGKARLQATLGLRSAGTHRDVVLLAGPALDQQALHLFAFNAKSGVFIGSHRLAGYRNIRKWIVAEGELYTTAGRNDGSGALIRWAGTTANPFTFVEVGSLPSEGAEIALHNGRLYVATWPNINPAAPVYAGIFRTAALPRKGGLKAGVTGLEQFWDVRQYEPDPVVALSYGGGALASFNGHLMWGTMHVPGVATQLHFAKYQAYYAALPDDGRRALMQLAAVLGTQRAIAIFSNGRNGTQLLYGQSRLPAFDPQAGGWSLPANASSLLPRHGFSGFNNPFNNYTWTMAQAGGALFVGTMDYSYLIRSNVESLLGGIASDSAQLESLRTQVLALPGLQEWLAENPQVLAMTSSALANPGPTFPEDNPLGYGADLMRFDDAHEPAEVASREGLGNFLNYGVRTMIGQGDTLYIGTANPMNLETLQNDSRPEGGWELLRVKVKQ
ncbi:MAG: hypothetical protein RL026_347 [Pseudomonadota bacterium]